MFIAGQIIFGHFAARKTEVSISSAIPFATFAIVFAVAGAIKKISAFCASETWLTLNSKFLSKVSMKHLCPLKVSNVIGLIMFVAFFVISTRTSAPVFTSMLTSVAALYAAMLPVTPTKIVLSFSIFYFPFAWIQLLKFYLTLVSCFCILAASFLCICGTFL